MQTTALLACLCILWLSSVAGESLHWVHSLPVHRLLNRVSATHPNTSFRVAHFALPAANQSPRLVSVATQCSVQHAHHLSSMATAWDGRVSAAVLVAGVGLNDAVAYLVRLRQCSASVLAKVDFHLVFSELELASVFEYTPGRNKKDSIKENYERNRAFRLSLSLEHWIQLLSTTSANHRFIQADCASVTGQGLTGLIQSPAVYQFDLPYPNNFLRNVARAGVATLHVILLDVDMITSPRMAHIYEQSVRDRMRQGESSLTAFVVPCLRQTQLQWHIISFLSSTFSNYNFSCPSFTFILQPSSSKTEYRSRRRRLISFACGTSTKFRFVSLIIIAFSTQCIHW